MPGTINTVEEYLVSLPVPVSGALGNLRKAIKSAAPKAEELISYRIPLYRYRGHLVAFMAAKKHCSFVTMSRPLVDALKAELKPFKISGTTIHFTPEKPLPAGLVKKIVKARMKENEMSKKPA